MPDDNALITDYSIGAESPTDKEIEERARALERRADAIEQLNQQLIPRTAPPYRWRRFPARQLMLTPPAPSTGIDKAFHDNFDVVDPQQFGTLQTYEQMHTLTNSCLIDFKMDVEDHQLDELMEEWKHPALSVNPLTFEEYVVWFVATLLEVFYEFRPPGHPDSTPASDLPPAEDQAQGAAEVATANESDGASSSDEEEPEEILARVDLLAQCQWQEVSVIEDYPDELWSGGPKAHRDEAAQDSDAVQDDIDVLASSPNGGKKPPPRPQLEDGSGHAVCDVRACEMGQDAMPGCFLM